MKMICPHCAKPSLFECVHDITCRPVIEDWDISASVKERVARCVCLECDKPVELDFKQQYIKPVQWPEVVYDDEVRRILEVSKTNNDKLVPEGVLRVLREKNFRKITNLMTGREMRVAVLEQT